MNERPVRESSLDIVLGRMAEKRPPVPDQDAASRDAAAPRPALLPSGDALRRAGAYFAKKGIHTPETLVELRLAGANLPSMALAAGVEVAELNAIVDSVARAMDPKALRRLEEGVAAPRATGQIDWADPKQKEEYERKGWKPVRALDRAAFDRIEFRDLLPYLIPRGPKKAVDLRPFLGDARNQNPRGTCAVQAAVAVAEAFEYFRDRRAGTADLAEQFVWWYRGAGQRYSAGGYDGSAALDDIREVGVCEEANLPYQRVQINNNHTQVPIPDKAMARAQFYRVGAPVGLPWGDVAAVKKVIDSGRCVLYGSNLDGWNTGTGEIVMPPAGTALGGGHCTTLVGYIDDDSLPAELEGGHFIVRNSWGGAGDANNVLGPEYGGHLLMPYAWYRQYAGWPATTVDRNDAAATNEWLVEYYDNRELRGAPIETRSVELSFLFLHWHQDVAVPQTAPAVDFNWGGGSAVQVTFPFPFSTLGAVDVLPKDDFSVRFSKVQRFREGFYRFRLRGDDGVRLYVDDRLVINQWKDQPSTEYTATHHVTGGDHVLRVEYYEAKGAAEVHLEIEPVQWHYELFSSGSVTGTATATFDDTLTDLEWRHAPPVPPAFGKTLGRFGLRGTASLAFEAGTYRLHALHSGNVKLYVDGVLHHSDDGTNPTSAPITLTAGNHEIRVELENLSTVPAPGSHSYYKAFCRFGWSDDAWRATFYQNTRAKQISDAGTVRDDPDGNHLFFRTCGLTGEAQVKHDYPPDAADDLKLTFADWDAFKVGVGGWPASFDLQFFGVWVRRRVFVPKAGPYNVELNANEGFRVTVDGKEVVQNQEFIANDPYNGDVYLDAGLHDLSVEYNGTKWGGNLNLRVRPVTWSVKYYAGKDLTAPPAVTTTVGSVSEVAARAGVLYRENDFSAIATRTVWLPVGRYAFSVRADDGVRLVVNKRTLIDAWVDQGPTDYAATYEHAGGWLAIAVEYYQAAGGKTLQVAMANQDFYGEYYRGTTLNQVPAGSSARRVAPMAYRYEEDVDFDFGRGSYLPRVGATDFSARWMGKVTLPVGRWRVEATCDDGVRVFVDGRLLIDSWKDQVATKHTRQIDLTGRAHDVKVEYYQKSDRSVCRVQYFRVI